MELPLSITLFDRVRKADPNFSRKIIPINGDIYEANLGISPKANSMIRVDGMNG
jgi:hypothetical protein